MILRDPIDFSGIEPGFLAKPFWILLIVLTAYTLLVMIVFGRASRKFQANIVSIGAVMIILVWFYWMFLSA